MYAIAFVFLGILLRGFIGEEAVDLVKMPFGLDLPVGSEHGAGTVVMQDGIKMLQIPLWQQLLCGVYPSGNCSLHRHGTGLGIPFSRQRWADTGDGGD